MPDVFDKARYLWKRVRCIVTLNHIDPGCILIAQRIFVCKRCGKVLKP